jgi:hypothetical protein
MNDSYTLPVVWRMAEFGYALHAKTHAALMPVMNTAFGPPEQLPFDLAHPRNPIQYHCVATAGNDERRDVRARLSRKLEERLRLQIKATESCPLKTLAEERVGLVRENPSMMTEPWRKPLLRELIIRGRIDEPHASGYLMKHGFGYLSRALNSS